MPETKSALKLRAMKVFETLKSTYPDARCALNFNTPFELLIATILSAQCTDARVNIVTSNLFQKFRTPEDFTAVSDSQLEKEIFSTGFYRQKARHIKSVCKILVEKHNGMVPENFEELNKMPGVGRKTASVIVGNAFGIPAIAVDTHVKRLSNLLGFVNTSDPDKIELELMKIIPREDWTLSSHLLATHGRTTCIARRPMCGNCSISQYCPSKLP